MAATDPMAAGAVATFTIIQQRVRVCVCVHLCVARIHTYQYVCVTKKRCVSVCVHSCM